MAGKLGQTLSKKKMNFKLLVALFFGISMYNEYNYNPTEKKPKQKTTCFTGRRTSKVGLGLGSGLFFFSFIFVAKMTLKTSLCHRPRHFNLSQLVWALQEFSTKNFELVSIPLHGISAPPAKDSHRKALFSARLLPMAKSHTSGAQAHALRSFMGLQRRMESLTKTT